MPVSLELFPAPEPWVQGRGWATATRWLLLSSLPTVPAPQRLQPGARVSQREGILVSVQGNPPFCRGGAEAERGRILLWFPWRPSRGRLGKWGVRPWPGVGELAAVRAVGETGTPWGRASG